MVKKLFKIFIKAILIVAALVLVFWLCIFYINKSNNVYIGLGHLIHQHDTFTLTLNVDEIEKLENGGGLESVQFLIWQRRLDAIGLYLESPDGMKIELTNSNGKLTAWYWNTTLRDDADSLIFSSSPPFKNIYRPHQFLHWLNNGKSLKGKWKLHVVNRFTVTQLGFIFYWKLKFTDKPNKPMIVETSPLPLMVIETGRKGIKDDKKIAARLYIVEQDSSGMSHLKDTATSLQTKIKIEIRGFSSVRMPKKNYGLRTISEDKKEKNISLLGLPPDCDWILNANCMDRSFARNIVMYELYRQMGYYASRSRMVELVMNGQYMGVYVLHEKIKMAEKRINNVGEFPNGFLVKLDTPLDNKPGWFSPREGFDGKDERPFFQYIYPAYSNIDTVQRTYLQQQVDLFENGLEDITDIDSLEKLIDIRSFADFLLLQEFAKNPDAYNLSIYMYRNKRGQIAIGPIWDFDRALGNGTSDHARFTKGFKHKYSDRDASHPTPMWWQNLIAKPAFKKLLKERWTELRLGILSERNIHYHVDSISQLVEPVQERNFKLWPVLGVKRSNFYSNPSINTYAKEVADLKTWIHHRLKWLDKNIPAL